MVYLDSSVILAELFSETRRPSADLWEQQLVSSRLTEYEVWNRAHARGFAHEASASIADLLGRVAFIELSPLVLARAKESFTRPVRTLDALHLATCAYLLRAGQTLMLASFDERMNEAALLIGLKIY